MAPKKIEKSFGPLKNNKKNGPETPNLMFKMAALKNDKKIKSETVI